MKSFLTGFVLCLLIFSGAAIARGGFPDVPTNAWFHQYVMAIKDWGVISGNDDGTFAPGRNITRAEFSKMLFLYDQRVDQKLANAGTPVVQSLPAPSNVGLPTVLYLRKSMPEPAQCPTGWDEVSYARQWDAGPMERICVTNKTCNTLYIDAFNQEPNQCPSGWSEADYGKDWTEGGQSKLRRACYICR